MVCAWLSIDSNEFIVYPVVDGHRIVFREKNNFGSSELDTPRWRKTRGREGWLAGCKNKPGLNW